MEQQILHAALMAGFTSGEIGSTGTEGKIHQERKRNEEAGKSTVKSGELFIRSG